MNSGHLGIAILSVTAILVLGEGNDCHGPCKCERQGNVVHVDCSNDGHCATERVPRFPNASMYTDTVLLNMTSCSKLHLDEAPFKKFTNLQVLVLHHCSLRRTDINNTTFTGLSKLRSLDISRNEQFPLVDTTPGEIFAHFTSLEELRAYGTTATYNHGTGYPEAVLRKLPSLKHLWLDGFNSSFGPVFQELSNLTELIITGAMIEPPWRSLEFCNMRCITSTSLQNLVHVKRLSILKCGVHSVEKNAFESLIKLEYIDMSGNSELGLVNISYALASLSKTVKEIVLNNVENSNHLSCGVIMTENIVENMKDLNITTLRAEHNAINSIKQNAFDLLPKSLENVYLSRNEFEMGMYMFYVARMPNLKHLDISFNFFSDAVLMLTRNNKPRLTFPEPNDIEFQHRNYYSMRNPANTSSTNGARCPSTFYYIPPGSITIYVPQKLEEINLSSSKLGLPIYELFFTNNTVKTLNISNSLVNCWEGPIHGAGEVRELDLSFNGCSMVSPNFFSTFRKLERLYLQRNLLYSAVGNDKDAVLFKNNKNLTYLDMSFNHIYFIPKDFLQNQALLEEVDLSDNGLQKFETTIQHMSRLKYLDLSNNHIMELSQDIQRQFIDIKRCDKNLSVNLEGNPIECSCSRLEFLRWVYSNMDADKSLTVQINTCILNSVTHTEIKSRSDLEHIIKGLEKSCASYSTLLICVTIAVVILLNIIVAGVVHRFRWKIRYWYYVVRSPKICGSQSSHMYRPLYENARFKYDLYVTSVNEDRTFVMESLKPNLGSIYKLFLQEDDILPGQNMYSIIANAIHVSKVVMFVISNDSLDDPFWHIAIRFAQEESNRRGQQMFFGIFLDTWVKWCSDIDAIRRSFYLDVPRTRGNCDMSAFWHECSEMIEDLENRQIFSYE